MSSGKIQFRVGKGVLAPADDLAAAQLREKGYNIGDLVNGEITKPRNSGFHRLAHQFGVLVSHNLDDFEGLDGHQTIKRLQWLADVECEHVAINVPGYGTMEARWPRSLAFGSMDEGRFKPMMRALAGYVATKYWNDDVDADEVLAMAQEMAGEAA
tara:strand:+ start:1187 stop:1654 length:468 start_codon:yes stop_codon:yes gene_type:complete